MKTQYNAGVAYLSDIRHWINNAFRTENYIPLALTFGAYLASVKFTQYLVTVGHTAPALILPSAGIAMAATILWGYEMALAIALAVLIGGITGAAAPLVIIASTIANVIQPLTGVYILRRFKFDLLLANVWDMFMLLGVAVFVTMIVPSIVLGSQYLQHMLIDATFVPSFEWGWYWAGEVLSVLILTPFLIRWIGKPEFSRTRSELFEISATFVLLVWVDYFLFWTPTSQFSGVSLVILLLVPLMWMALRVGPRFMTFALFLTAAIGLSGAVFGTHSTVQPISTRLSSVEIFMEIIALIFLVIVAAIEERKNTAQKLTQHVEQLEAANQKIVDEDNAKSEFLAVLAHELRNPLAPLFSSLELLKLQDSNNKEVIQLVEGMDQQVRTMGRLLDDLLDVTRVSRNKFQLHKESIELGALVKRSLKSTESLLVSRKHSFTVTLPKESLRVLVDPLRFEQMIANLLTNSAKYTPPGGAIELIFEAQGTTLVMRVRDSGLGIPEDMLRTIFEPFMQLQQGGRFRSTGLGIGLSLTKHLVEMHGGTIEAKSAGIGKGSEFIVRLPVLGTVDIPTMQNTGTISNPLVTASTLKILIVDDNELAAKSLRRLLEYRGHDVTVAYDGAEAFEAVSKFSPDVVLLDIGLPDVDGYEVARRLRENPDSRLVLIALSGYGQEEDKRKAREAGFNHHLTKPASLADVEALLSQVPPLSL